MRNKVHAYIYEAESIQPGNLNVRAKRRDERKDITLVIPALLLT